LADQKKAVMPLGLGVPETQLNGAFAVNRPLPVWVVVQQSGFLIDSDLDDARQEWSQFRGPGFPEAIVVRQRAGSRHQVQASLD